MAYGILFLIIYFLPSVIALTRNHNNLNAILVTNLLLGWTIIGWIAAMIWAHTKDVKENK